MRINLTGDSPAIGLGHHVPAYDPFTILSVGSAALTAGGSILGGISSKQAYDAQAAQLERQANVERAQASQASAQKFEDQQTLMSNQVAAAAASGGGANDPSVLDIYGDTAQRGYVQRQAIDANGENGARGYETQAAAAKQSGKSAEIGGFISAAASGLKAAAGVYAPKISPILSGPSKAFLNFGSKYMPTADPFAEDDFWDIR